MLFMLFLIREKFIKSDWSSFFTFLLCSVAGIRTQSSFQYVGELFELSPYTQKTFIGVEWREIIVPQHVVKWTLKYSFQCYPVLFLSGFQAQSLCCSICGLHCLQHGDSWRKEEQTEVLCKEKFSAQNPYFFACVQMGLFLVVIYSHWVKGCFGNSMCCGKLWLPLLTQN